MLVSISIIIGAILVLLLIKRLQPDLSERRKLYNLLLFIFIAGLVIIGLLRIGAPIIALVSSVAVVVLTLIDRVSKFVWLWRLVDYYFKRGSSVKPKANSKLTRAQALAILNLSGKPKSSEIKASYNKLMKQVHPDKGGSPYLAQQLNEAKDLLLKQCSNN